MKLVIVESPAKARTIERFLGAGFSVAASYGHVRDLPRSAREVPGAVREKAWSSLGVDTENGFKPVYVVPAEAKKHLSELSRLLRNADEVLLATDEDREGEAISWHLVEVLKPRVPVRRVAFHEITSRAVREAIAAPREMNLRLVRAQETRRVLDRLYGYSLSPVLWRKVRTKLSAGRVQSVALRLIVDREEARMRFKAAEYWRVRAALAAGDLEFAAVLRGVDGRRIATSKDFDPDTGRLKAGSRARVLSKEDAERIASGALAAVPWRVGVVERKSSRQRPAPPFTTSTLQQAASRRLRMSPRRTMRAAQRLYEGMDLGVVEREGLITYMRTDSVTLSQKALSEAADYIRKSFGPEYHDGARRYRTKSKVAQEAHEAIRPTRIARSPESVASLLGDDELAVYRLVWSRAVASQMADARIDRASVELVATFAGADHAFHSSGSTMRFPGFLKVYGDRRKDQLLPPLEKGDEVHREGNGRGAPAKGRRTPGAVLRGAEPESGETKPPPRYTEASLVKKLEEEGIGRPSTYTPTISTIQDRDYVRKRAGALVPTYVGMAVTHLLRDHFGQYVDIGFTARMEDSLDGIARGEKDSRRFLDVFFNGEKDRPGLQNKIQDALPGIAFPSVSLGADPESGERISVRIGRNSVYAERGEGERRARATVPDDVLIDELTVERASELLASRERGEESLGTDPETGKSVLLRSGPYGPYIQLGQPPKPKRVSVPKGVDPSSVDLEYALKLLSLPRLVGLDPESGDEVRVGLGRYGPYAVSAGKYCSLASPEQLFTLTLEEALARLADAKRKGRRGTVLASLGEHPDTGGAVVVRKGRYGPYVTDGKVNASVPKGRDPAGVTLSEAVEMLAKSVERRKKGSGGARGRRSSSRGRGRSEWRR